MVDSEWRFFYRIIRIFRFFLSEFPNRFLGFAALWVHHRRRSGGSRPSPTIPNMFTLFGLYFLAVTLPHNCTRLLHRICVILVYGIRVSPALRARPNVSMDYGIRDVHAYRYLLASTQILRWCPIARAPHVPQKANLSYPDSFRR